MGDIIVKKILICLIFLLLTSVSFGETKLTDEQKEWIEEHSDQTLTLGLDPYSGMDYFEFRGDLEGYIVDVVDLIEKETGLSIEIIGDSTWGAVYEGLYLGSIDILFGANVTEERLKYMDFTMPIHQYPYAVFANRNSDIQTLGDFEKGKIGFIEGDVAIKLFKEAYPQIQGDFVEFDNQIDGLLALEDQKIDGFITSGGGIIYDFLYNYPQIKFLLDLEDISSDMTLATLKQNTILNQILSQVIESNQEIIYTYIEEAEVLYNRKILNLTEQELSWLEEEHAITVGVVEDYLPFDYFEDGEYKGVAGKLVEEISNLVGIRFIYQYGDFDTIYDLALKGEVDLLNIAKTDERMDKFLFPRAFSKERDLIYGHKKTAYIGDIYGLEDKRVAVIKGFWHEDLLRKNLRNVQIIVTDSIQESIKLVNNGRADYFIENPTVADYYISGLGYWNIVKKGETSQDSFLYFGIYKDQDELASIIDKTLRIIDYDSIKQEGMDTVPSLVSRSVKILILAILFLILVTLVVVWGLIKTIKAVIREREEKAVLKAREKMMYLDPLTGLYNRLYYNMLEKKLDEMPFPQAVIISDLNHLKNINDTMGHHMGDAYIQAYGELLSMTCKECIICRMGGDEFVIIRTDCDAMCAEALVKSISETLKNKKVTRGKQTIDSLNAAIGYAIRYDEKMAIETISIQADNMMYAHKKKMKFEDAE